MKARLFLGLVFFITFFRASAQTPLPSSGPTFLAKDSTKADVIAVASLQAYPISIDKLGAAIDSISEIVPVTDSITETIRVETVQRVADPGPKRAWSNPPGYQGALRPVTTVKHKSKTNRKYHHPQRNRCPTF